ncbi:hypothetical protein LT85_4841 [Collimonas arenae]|uniref:Fe-S protein n=1 Tax=Collimonas arenae TaxID=279058 RepID=A0A0A1FK06_9BURK|nr:DUF1289 domain-containing protein [Collimonas arenae]AIY43999.1 hypothetical protein LT85_4841 [Collimonas arenae]
MKNPYLKPIIALPPAKSDDAAAPAPDCSASPCINICVMNAENALCDGCQRTLDEIVLWGSASDAQKRAIWQRILQRRLQMGMAP